MEVQIYDHHCHHYLVYKVEPRASSELKKTSALSRIIWLAAYNPLQWEAKAGTQDRNKEA